MGQPTVMWTCDDCGSSTLWPRRHAGERDHVEFTSPSRNRLRFTEGGDVSEVLPPVDREEVVPEPKPDASTRQPGRWKNPRPASVRQAAMTGSAFAPTADVVSGTFMGTSPRDNERAALRAEMRAVRRKVADAGLCYECTGDVEHFPTCSRFRPGKASQN
jgi:hypothetical protein